MNRIAELLRFSPLVTLAFAVGLLIAACQDAPVPASPTPTSSPYTGYLAEAIPPCTPITGSLVDPCELNAARLEGGIGQSFSELSDEPWSVREMLDGPAPGFRVPHLMLRASYLPGTVRCTSGDYYRPPPHLADEWDARSFKCYVDVRANAYILGSGPLHLTVLFLIDYVYASYAARGEVEGHRQELETLFKGIFPGREHVIFLGPPDDLSSEAWRFLGYWDVQRQEDGTVIAVHRERDIWRSLRPQEYQVHRSVLEMELPALTQAVTAANQARVSEFGGRIGADPSLPLLLTDANNLRQYYVSTGAYDHPEGTPVPPPPVPDEDDSLTDNGAESSPTPAGAR